MALTSIIVPTYSEAGNLRELVSRTASAMQSARADYEIIVVDDNSPDDTRQVCHGLSQNYPLSLLVRENERGLSSAVLAGLYLARGEFLVVMDADLSHPPESVPRLLKAVSNDGFEFAVGSRYVPGGSTEEGWGVLRYLNSRVATLLARPLTSVRDPMAGFFAIRRDVFLNADQLNPIGYKIGLELIVKCRCREIAEIPIHFANRKLGSSKLCLREQLNYIRHLGKLYVNRFLRKRSVATRSVAASPRTKQPVST
jgi:dolichol-phosphate mannosyltransferase